jgi:hypothetical protein
MTERIRESRRRVFGGRKLGFLALLPIMGLLVVTFAVSASGQTATCNNPATLGTGATGSAFEIDTNANLVVDNSACIDWLNGGGTAFRTGVLTKERSAERVDRRLVRKRHVGERRQRVDHLRLDSAEQERPEVVRRLHRGDREREVPRAVLVTCPEPVRDDEHGLRAEPEVLQPVCHAKELREQRFRRYS